VLGGHAGALDLRRVITVGHSAGGQLALCAAAEAAKRDRPAPAVSVAAAVGLAPLADLARAHDEALGGGAVAAFLGGSPAEHPDRYRSASPRARLPLRVPQLIMHGTADDAVPIEHTRAYVRAARESGDSVELIELPDTGHMPYLDPASSAHATLCRWLAGTARSLGGPDA
jgi:dipeptidyl aminopeptidase/acylaminoacyl peptidase